MALLHGQGRPAAMSPARRREVVGPRLRREQQLLQVRPGHPLQPPPLLDGKQNSGFDAAPGHNLRPFGERGIQQLAEPRFGILDRPSPAHSSPQSLSV